MYRSAPLRSSDKWWILLLIFAVSLVPLISCAEPTVYVIQHQRQTAGESVNQSFTVDGPMVNSNYTVARSVRHVIDLSLTGKAQLDRGEVQDNILNAYSLPPRDDKTVCAIPVEVPEGKRYVYDLQWTENWAEGVLKEGKNGEGAQLGTYRVLIGYDCQVTAVHPYDL